MNSVDARGKVNTYTMLGREYIFFLSNEQLGESYYSYQFYSPGLTEELDLIISLAKVNERTPISKDKEPGEVDKKEKSGSFYQATTIPNGKDIDLISYLSIPNSSPKWDKDRRKFSTNYLKNLLKRNDDDEPKVVKPKTARDFPGIKADLFDKYNNAQRTLITQLRDNLRWKYYSFKPGNRFDILYSTTEFLVMELKENVETKELYLDLIAVYKNTDPDMKNPLNINFNNIELPNFKWSSTNKGVESQINRSIKAYESDSFNRKELLPPSKRK